MRGIHDLKLLYQQNKRDGFLLQTDKSLTTSSLLKEEGEQLVLIIQVR